MPIRIGNKFANNKSVEVKSSPTPDSGTKPNVINDATKEKTTPEAYIRKGCFRLKKRGDKQSNYIVPDDNKNSIVKLPEDWDCLGADGEFWSQTDKRTDPLCISLYSAEKFHAYLHPNSSLVKDKALLAHVQDKLKAVCEEPIKVFQSPNVILDFLHDEFKINWRHIQDLKRRKVKILKLFFFFSFKDLELLWAKNPDFLYYCLPYLERIRRITTKFNKPIPLPYEIAIPGGKGVQWTAISLEVVDICAMQGAKNLKTYLQNVGLSGDTKELWDWNENNNPIDFLLQKPKEFMQYLRGDVDQLKPCHDKTIDFYNEVAEMVGVQPNDKWGMSTGKITARIASEWLAGQSQVNLPTSEVKEKDKTITPFYWYNRLASPEAIKQLSHLTGNQKLLYLGMTDGGRCVKERSKVDVLEGVLIDVDINGCYGNGLKNQFFPVGNPSIMTQPMNFKEWESQYSKHLVLGLWVARISWKDAPFKQDLLMSKIQKTFTAWEWYQSHFAEHNSDSDKQFDSSMYMGTNEVCCAVLNHDLLQVIHKYTDNNELAWIRENAVIDCFAYYDKRDEIESVIPEMTEVVSLKELHVSGLKWSTKWVRVDLKYLVGILLDKRGGFKKKIKFYNKHFVKNNKKLTIDDVPENQMIDGVEFSKKDFLYQNSIQEFIKLIVNTIYGCMASSYFATEGTGISNYIVGNNVTARARALAWCMAKGLYSLMSITDGGVFDANKVCFYRRKSLNIFSELGFDKFKGSNGQTVIDILPLYGENIEISNMFDILDESGEQTNHVQVKAWKHLKDMFGELDIFKFDQYSFEVKKIYTNCEIRNKSDYHLTNILNGDKLTKIRGLTQRDGDTLASSIFQDILDEKSGYHEIETTRLLGLAEWREMNSEEQKRLLPHDEVSCKKKFFSITPLGCKFINADHHKDVIRLYIELKQTNQNELIAKLRDLENVTSLEEYEILRAKFRAEAKAAKEAKRKAAKANTN